MSDQEECATNVASVGEPPGVTALRLLDLVARTARRPLIHVAADDRAAAALHAVVAALAPACGAALFPGWDSPPYDRAQPSRGIMGRRMGVLRWLTDRASPPDLVITTPMGLLQRVPPRAVWPEAHLEFRAGEPFDPEEAARALERLGYVPDERADEPGEMAVHGKVIDLFPAAAPLPCRIEHEQGRIAAIRSYDPHSQRTEADSELLVVDPASEIVRCDAAADVEGADDERFLPDAYASLETLFDYAPAAAIVGARADRLDGQIDAAWARIAEAYENLLDLRRLGHATRLPPSPERLYLTPDEWRRLSGTKRLDPPVEPFGWAEIPRYHARARPGPAFAADIRAGLAGGGRVVLAASPADIGRFARRAARALDEQPQLVDSWAAALAVTDRPALLPVPIDAGFRTTLPSRDGTSDIDVTVVAAADLLNGRAGGPRKTAVLDISGGEFHLGDAVVHLDHGMTRLQGLETIAGPSGEPADMIRLEHAAGKMRLVPIGEIGQLWRYGAEADAVSLDKVDGDAWTERHASILGEVDTAAARLVKIAREREARTAAVLSPPRRAWERFASRFAYPLTPDQRAAVDAILDDLAAGRPMDRLVCGDVGYGKTEVALLAAAAVALAGKQVAIAAPTTVLAQQHLRTFTRRFAGFDLPVASLSRVTGNAEARKVKAGLADGSIRIVVGTHALAGKGVSFADLGLVILDEEQRFGARHKATLAGLGQGAHVLRLTATPIPRTLQAGLAGLLDLSVIATPPVMRQPVRTVLAPFDPATVRIPLMRERQRGGQSFVVCPRIEDIAPMADRLRRIVPELRVVVVHGKLPAAEIDAAMVGFADGVGDVLLATNIIESGLDVPGANTMLVWRPDRFGLAQLHQLRGRVGRGARRGTVYLLTDPEQALPPATEKRLRTLESLSGLGAGFEIAACDLDLRGAGDLWGEEQTGHIKLIGTALYHHMLERALAIARGKMPEDRPPEINLGVAGRIPPDYVPDEEVRLNLYARLDRLADETVILAFEDELDDRFGAPPAEVDLLLRLAALRAACRARGIVRLDGGPDALAATVREGFDTGWKSQDARIAWNGQRLLFRQKSNTDMERLALAATFLDGVPTA